MDNTWDEFIGDIANSVNRWAGNEFPISVRRLLLRFGFERRGSRNVEIIRSALESYGLETLPDFEFAYIDATVKVRQKQAVDPVIIEHDPPQLVPMPSLGKKGATDPTYRIGKLASANTELTFVRPDDPVEKAVTLMMSNQFSQLPVMTGKRDVKGVISWKSLGSRLAMGASCDVVRECMEAHQEIIADTSLFEAIPAIVENQYVLIRDDENKICGMVTTSDLSLQFQQLGEPFLLIGEVENYVRRMIRGKFTGEELAAGKDPASDTNRQVENEVDLTFGELVRFVEDPRNWMKLTLAIDRVEFVTSLDRIRRIRNDVMHFDPDGIGKEDLEFLRQETRFIQELREIAKA